MKTIFKTPRGIRIILSDAQAMAKEHPDTFDAPSLCELNDIQVGDFVKLTFNNKERMWVKVTKIGNDWDHYEGELSDEPFDIRDVHLGDLIPFKKENVYVIVK